MFVQQWFWSHCELDDDDELSEHLRRIRLASRLIPRELCVGSSWKAYHYTESEPVEMWSFLSALINQGARR